MATPSFYPVTGRSDTGIVAPRLAIEALQKKDEQFSLFILSYLIIQDRQQSLPQSLPNSVLESFRSTDEHSDEHSALPIPPGTGPLPAAFFNISAIHGKPYQRWSGDDKEYPTDFDNKDGKDTGPGRFGGYCNHGSVLFPTWHRPYVLLIEQSIGKQATDLATRFDRLEGGNSTKWRDAAKELRFPYWDWAAPEIETDGLPSVLYKQKVAIKVPKSEGKVDVENPLAFFPLTEIPADFSNEDFGGGVTCYFRDWKTTLRHAEGKSKGDKTRIDDLQSELKDRARDLRSKVAALFTVPSGQDSSKTWDVFSNHSPVTISRQVRAFRGSLEGVHDEIHGIIGGLGHMGFPDYAGFDPIFFLHHANVDRLYALWEYCYRNEDNGKGYWMGDGYTTVSRRGVQHLPWIQPQGTFAEVIDAQVLPTSSLAPFRRADGEYWTSEDVRYFDDKAYKKYYTYETAGIKVDAPATDPERIAARKKIHDFYTYQPQPKQLRGGLFKAALAPEKLPKNVKVIEGQRQFAVVVELLEHAYNGPYTFKLFFKKPTTKGEEAKSIGAVYVFARPDDSPCAACRGKIARSTKIRGVIFIGEATIEELINDDKIKTGDVNEVANALKDALYAELQDPAGVKLAVVVPRIETASVASGIEMEKAPPAVASGVETEVTPPDVASGVETDETSPTPPAAVSIQLISTAVAREKKKEKEKEEAPVQWVDWATHGDVFDSKDYEWTEPQA